MVDPRLSELAKSYKCETLREQTEKIKLVQHNLVLVVNYGNIVHVLQHLAKVSPKFSRTTGTFPRVQLSSNNPKVTVMIFFSGSAVFVGGKELTPTLYVALRTRLWLEKTRKEFLPRIKKESLVFGKPFNANLVFTAHLPDSFYDLAKFAANTERVNYEPEVFPGANLKIRSADGKPLCQVMVFERGYVNVMGSQSLNHAYYAIDTFYNLIAPYACEPKAPTDDIVSMRESERQIALSEVANAIKKDGSLFSHILSDMEENLKSLGVKMSVADLIDDFDNIIID